MIYDHTAAENMVIYLIWELVSPWHTTEESSEYLRPKIDRIWEIPLEIDYHESQIGLGQFILMYMNAHNFKLNFKLYDIIPAQQLYCFEG